MPELTKTCFTAIFSNYEDLKRPTIISKDWRYICFTDQPIESDVWEIVKIEPHLPAQRMARYIKIMWHLYIESEYSLWLDASFQINIDLNIWWERTFKIPFSCPKHPLRTDVFQEIKSCLVNKRGDPELLLKQELEYARIGVKRFNGIITSGVLMRMRDPQVIDLCEKWWLELEQYSSRDQIAFARVAEKYLIHTFVWDYSQSREIKFYRHYHLRSHESHYPVK